MLLKVFGEEKLSGRVVLGVASLPLGLPIELELVLEVEAGMVVEPTEHDDEPRPHHAGARLLIQTNLTSCVRLQAGQGGIFQHYAAFVQQALAFLQQSAELASWSRDQSGCAASTFDPATLLLEPVPTLLG